MKKTLILAVIAMLLFSCKATNEPKGQMVDVIINLSGIDIQVTPENAPRGLPTASDADVSAAKVKRIALSVFDATTDTLVKSVTQSQETDTTNFGTISMRIPIGTYKFVVVAHGASTADIPADTISSVSMVSHGAAAVNNPTYSVVQNVTLSGNTTQLVTIDMGTRRSALFGVRFTDDSPAEVVGFEIIIAPASSAYTNLTFNPATGFTTVQWQFKRVSTLAELGHSNLNSGKNYTLPVMLPSTTDTVDVTINTFDSENNVNYTRTLQNVPLQQAHRTIASGTFFSPEVTTSFMFDVTEITDNIPLD